MAVFDTNRFSSINQEWETPDSLFDQLNNKYHFTHDVCATKENSKCSSFWTKEDNALSKTWSGICWMNPPYKQLKQFVIKAHEQRKNAYTVCLIPARTNTNWWHRYCMQGEVYFICGRPKFKNCVHGFPQPLAIVVFGGKTKIYGSYYISGDSCRIEE